MFTYGQLIDAERWDRSTVAPQLGDERQFIQVPDDAGSVSGATHNDVVSWWCCETCYCICVSQKSLHTWHVPHYIQLWKYFGFTMDFWLKMTFLTSQIK